jgi:hypothetical protein
MIENFGVLYDFEGAHADVTKKLAEYFGATIEAFRGHKAELLKGFNYSRKKRTFRLRNDACVWKNK